MPSDFLTMPVYPAPRLNVTFPPKTWLLVLLFLPVLGLCVVFDLVYFLITRMR
ncbi:MAG: hypothetical protein KJO42_10245 [Silicimonas sp.]|nr:hypothetical protein [Silicimonas sp.]NND20583.1 hypothetical protein [Silicimonas sp.]NNL72036.1 hypothetical protein [Silicimonas sp.]